MLFALVAATRPVICVYIHTQERRARLVAPRIIPGDLRGISDARLTNWHFPEIIAYYMGVLFTRGRSTVNTNILTLFDAGERERHRQTEMRTRRSRGKKGDEGIRCIITRVRYNYVVSTRGKYRFFDEDVTTVRLHDRVVIASFFVSAGYITPQFLRDGTSELSCAEL